MGVADLLRRLDHAVLPSLRRSVAWSVRNAGRRRALVGVGVAGVVSLLVAAVWAGHQPPAGELAAPATVRVGILDGQSVESYAAQAREELDALTSTGGVAERYALVSFTAYLAPSRLGSVLENVSTHRVYAKAVLPDVPTSVVEITVEQLPDDLEAGMERVAEAREAQARSYRRDAARLTGDSEDEQSHRESYLAKAQGAASEALAYRSKCSCLFAAVVRATPTELARLGESDAVRTVDPAPEVVDLDRAVFVPPLPDQSGNGPETTSPSASVSGSPSLDPGAGSPSSGAPSVPVSGSSSGVDEAPSSSAGVGSPSEAEPDA